MLAIVIGKVKVINDFIFLRIELIRVMQSVERYSASVPAFVLWVSVMVITVSQVRRLIVCQLSPLSQAGCQVWPGERRDSRAHITP